MNFIIRMSIFAVLIFLPFALFSQEVKAETNKKEPSAKVIRKNPYQTKNPVTIAVFEKYGEDETKVYEVRQKLKKLKKEGVTVLNDEKFEEKMKERDRLYEKAQTTEEKKKIKKEYDQYKRLKDII